MWWGRWTGEAGGPMIRSRDGLVRLPGPGEPGRGADGAVRGLGGAGLGAVRGVGHHWRRGDPAVDGAERAGVHLDRAACGGADAEPPRAEPRGADGPSAAGGGRAEAAVEGADHDSGSGPHSVLAGADRDLHSDDRSVRRNPVRGADGTGGPERRRAVPDRHRVDQHDRGVHGGVVVEQQVRAAGCDADDRDADQLRADPGAGAAGGCAVRGQHEVGGYRRVASRTTACG